AQTGDCGSTTFAFSWAISVCQPLSWESIPLKVTLRQTHHVSLRGMVYGGLRPWGTQSVAFYAFRLGRRLNGSRTATPVGSKSDTLRVTMVSPCPSAVAAIMRSALSLPRAALRAP